MGTNVVRSLAALALGTVYLAASAMALECAAQEADLVDITDSAITLSASGRAELWFRTAGGAEHRIEFRDGTVRLDGSEAGPYEAEGRLAGLWREMLRERAGEDAVSVRAGLVDFQRRLGSEATSGDGEAATARALSDRLAEWLGMAATAGERATSETRARSIELAPGGLRYDYSGALARLESALTRLGDAAAAIEDGLAMIVHDDFSIPGDRTVDGDLALLDGTLRLAGAVRGDVLVLDGRLVLGDAARIEGDLLQVGGDLDLEGPEAVIGGEILADLSLAPEAPESPPAATEAPPAPVRAVQRSERRARRSWLDRVGYNVSRAAGDLMEVISAFVGLALLGLLLVRFGRERLETVADTVRHEFARSFAMGVAGAILFFPALLILVVLVITWPIVPFFLLACFLAAAAGYVAVAHGAGEMFARRRYRYEWLERLRRSNSYYYVLSGLVLLLLPFAAASVLWVLGGTVDALRGLLALVACIATVVLVTAGFGGVLLTRGGARSIVVEWDEPVERRHGYGPATDPTPPEAADPDEEPGEDDLA